MTIVGVLFSLSAAFAAVTNPQGISLEGNIVDRRGQPVEATSVAFTIEVLSPRPSSCVLYSETQTINMSGSGGNFSFVLGRGSRVGTTFEKTSSLNQILSPSGSFSGLRCASGTSYTAVPGAERLIQITFNDGNGSHSLYQPIAMQSVPFAFSADQLQGFGAENFLNLGTVAPLTQSNVENVFSPENYPKISAMLAATGTNGTSAAPLFSAPPANLSTGQFWFDPNSSTIRFYNGSSVQSFLSSAQVSGNLITAGTIGGNTSISTTGDLQTTGTLWGARLNFLDHSGVGPSSIALQAPANIAGGGGASYVLTLPNTAGATGQVLSTDGSGNLSWVSRTSGAVTSVTGTAPVTVTGTSAAPVINVSAASTEAPGVVTLAAAAGVTAGTVVQASDARLSDSRTPTGTASGDLAGTYPSPSVKKIFGTNVSAAPTLFGQALRYDGASWTPGFISMFDLRSTVTGSQQFSAGCTAGQTLTWIAATDNLSCSPIAIGDFQIAYAPEAAHAVLAGPVTGSAAPTFRSLVASDLPAGGYDTTYFKTGGNAFGGISSFGTTDAFSLILVTNNVNRLNILSGGNIGVGVGTPTAALHLKAGTAAAGTSPLKFTSGTNLTTPESGAVEFDGTSLFYTDSTATRRTLATTSSSSTYSGAITMSGAGTGLAVTNNQTIGGTLTTTGVASLNGGATIAANQNLTMTSGTGTFAQTYTGTATARSLTANSVTTTSAESITANGLTTGNILSLTSSSTAATTGQTGLNITISGANAASSVTRYALQAATTATGTTSTNVGAKFSASGGTTNYGLLVTAGSVGIGNSAPVAALDVTGHVANTGAAATMGACGTTPSITGNDARGTVTVGTGVVTSCIVNFNSAFPTAPYCVATVNGSASAIALGLTTTTTAMTLNFSASAPGLKFNYMCLQ